VNVNNIYIPKPSRVFVKPGTRDALEFILGCPKDLMAAQAAARPASGPPVFWAAADGRREAETAQIDQHLRFKKVLRRHRSLRRAASPRANSDATPCDIDQICSAIISAGGRGMPGGASAAKRSRRPG